jgi:hypothetical protein
VGDKFWFALLKRPHLDVEAGSAAPASYGEGVILGPSSRPTVAEQVSFAKQDPITQQYSVAQQHSAAEQHSRNWSDKSVESRSDWIISIEASALGDCARTTLAVITALTDKLPRRAIEAKYLGLGEGFVLYIQSPEKVLETNNRHPWRR